MHATEVAPDPLRDLLERREAITVLGHSPAHPQARASLGAAPNVPIQDLVLSA